MGGATVNYQRIPARREATSKLVLGAARTCDAERDWSMGWSMDLTDGAGNGRVRKPRIRVTKALRTCHRPRKAP